MRLSKKLLVAAILLASAALNARILSPAYTYSGLTWTFSSTTTGVSSCSDLVLDATGDPYNSDNYAIAGQLSCPQLGGNYASSGNAYFDSQNYFHMTITLGVTYQLVCDNLVGLSGSCPIYNNLGTQVGTAYISLL